MLTRMGDAPFPYQVCTRMYRMMMKVVSFTGGAAGVYAGLRAIVTGNATGEIPFAQEVIFVWLLIFFASSWRLAGAIFNSKSE
ncbi:hypothetical protein P8875_01325 [Bacillus haynesii]|nr:hypothetical protein [Bacillus haynesii]